MTPFVAGRDQHYTSGLYAPKLERTLAPADAPRGALIANALLLPVDGDARLYEGYFVGQAIFTPEDLLAFNPPTTDRPYAGWLFGGARLYRETDDVLDRADLTFGLVGPMALGSDVQKSWHALGIFGGLKPNGWHYQLRDEPGLVMSEQRTWRKSLLDGGIEMDALPEVNAAIGNIFTYAGAGGMLRIGQGLKGDWGPPRMAPGEQGSEFQTGQSGWYAFAGIEGRAVGRNIFLDGNSFVSSRSIGHETFVGDFNAGMAFLFPTMRADISYTQRSREFVGQHGNDEFVSINLSVRQ